MGTLQTQERAAEGAAAPGELEALVRSVYDNFNARKLDDAAALVSDDCELTDVATGTVFRGPSGHLEFDEAWIRAFSDARIELTNIVCQGDLVVTEMIGHGTHDGTLMGPKGKSIPPSGKRGEIRCVQFFQFKGKKIVRARFYYDALSMLEQLGVTK